MASNTTILAGNLTRAAVVRPAKKTGQPWASARMAVDQPDGSTAYFGVTAWKADATALGAATTRDKITVTGTIEDDSYTDKTGVFRPGQAIKASSVIVETAAPTLIDELRAHQAEQDDE